MADEKDKPYEIEIPDDLLTPPVPTSWLEGMSDAEKDMVTKVTVLESIAKWKLRAHKVQGFHMQNAHERIAVLETQLSKLQSKLKPYLYVGGAIGGGVLLWLVDLVVGLLKSAA